MLSRDILMGAARVWTPPTPDADAVLWRDAAVVNGATVSAGWLNQVSILIAALKAGGSWALTDDIWLLTAENSIQALTSLKQLRLAAAINSPALTPYGGYTFDGSTNYIGTGFIPSTHAVAMSATNVRISVYERTNSASTGYAAGVSVTSSRVIRIRPRSGTALTGNANFNTAAGWTVADSLGLSSVQSDGTIAGTVAYRRGVLQTRTVDPASFGATLPNAEIFIGGLNSAGAMAGGRASTLGYLALGAQLTAAEELAEYNAVQAHMTALGAHV